MNAHSTAVEIIDLEHRLEMHEDENEYANSKVCQPGHIGAKLRRLQEDHVWIRQQVTHVQRRLITQQLARQRRLYEKRERLMGLLRQLQVKYARSWGL
ncbi:hypothetical protein KR009_004818 [Drosophila setifemur]|nr:hypothetical protein KR009_004818 [Drosophila setifemur]